MRIKSWIFPLLIIFVTSIFFYKIFLDQIPFPGDLLVGNYEPYRSQNYGGYLPGAVPHKAQGPDVIKELIPWKKFAIESLKSGQVPFWNPYNFSGNPLMANFQSAVFFPTNIIFFIADFSSAWTLYIILIPLLAAAFTYIFLRRLKLSNAASVFGGVIFAFSSYMTVWMEYGNIGYTFIFLPLILYFADRILQKITLVSFLGLVTCGFLALIAGYIQGAFYIYLIASVYVLAKGFVNKVKISNFVIIFAGLLIPVLLSAFQLLPTLTLFGESSRGNYTMEQIEKMLSPFYYLITVAVPDFFGNPASRNYWIDGTYIERVSYFGLIPLIFAIFASISLFKKIEVKIFSILFIVSLILATDLFVTRFFYLIPIPVVSTTVATRILSIATFSGCILACYGLDELLSKKNLKKFVIVAAVVLLFIIILFASVNFIKTIEGFAIAKRNLIIPLVSLTAFLGSAFVYVKAKKKQEKIAKVVFIGIIFVIVFGDLFYYFHKITPFAPSQYMYPETPVMKYIKKEAGINRVWGYGLGNIDSDFQTFEGVYSTEGNDPLHIRKYTELVAASSNGRVPDMLPRPDANIAPGYGPEELANNPYRQKALNITGVKYVLAKSDILSGDYNPDYTTFPEDRYKLIWQEKPWQVYENLQVVPRVNIVDRYKVYSGDKKTINAIYNSQFDEKTELILNEDPKIEAGELKSSSKLISYTPSQIKIETESSKPAILYLSDTNYPEWKAYVDGRQINIMAANYAFRAVKLPEGKHMVEFKYVPESFTRGLYIGILGVIILIVVSIIIKKKYES